MQEFDDKATEKYERAVKEVEMKAKAVVLGGGLFGGLTLFSTTNCGTALTLTNAVLFPLLACGCTTGALLLLCLSEKDNRENLATVLNGPPAAMRMNR